MESHKIHVPNHQPNSDIVLTYDINTENTSELPILLVKRNIPQLWPFASYKYL